MFDFLYAPVNYGITILLCLITAVVTTYVVERKFFKKLNTVLFKDFMHYAKSDGTNITEIERNLSQLNSDHRHIMSIMSTIGKTVCETNSCISSTITEAKLEQTQREIKYRELTQEQQGLIDELDNIVVAAEGMVREFFNLKSQISQLEYEISELKEEKKELQNQNEKLKGELSRYQKFNSYNFQRDDDMEMDM